MTNPTQETSEWAVYRLKSGMVNAVPRKTMDIYRQDHEDIWEELVDEVLVTGLTEEQAKQYRRLTREET